MSVRSLQLIGCDFSSSPSRRKAIMLARGEWLEHRSDPCIKLLALERIESLGGFTAWLAEPEVWVGGFDLPFGLPRELVTSLQWPTDWGDCMVHFASLSRAQIREIFAVFCAARPIGGKFAHRATDGPAGSSPSMKWVNPPVAFMMHAGVPLLRAAGVHLPGLLQGDCSRVALEAYPGWLARQLVGRASYKSDGKAKQTPERAVARRQIVARIAQPLPMLDGIHVELNDAQREQLEVDASGDSVDAVLCMLEAGWAHRQHLSGHTNYGLPAEMDPLEGWIVGVQPR
ncbi:DUF429 domain-containing protein [Diaphorobacter sp. HDW4A]|uniref:DUF429 domain-containing protein n=1 Tax=Diaphorobacter sp. HDW4A TaxID=2714924 RepID=UPI00140AD46A|nr:DUF429 domain-containing protein [Diaphorobacter sp. HDW4A]QIL81397.1 DUF429 domain-containing protein [Diaphorobacter sp. HDW4A]